jgi:hypothetical protein
MLPRSFYGKQRGDALVLPAVFLRAEDDFLLLAREVIIQGTGNF